MKKIFFTVLLILINSKALAEFEIGFKYYEEGNYEKAFSQFMDAAHNGDHDAQYNLGVMYYRGEHVNKSLTDAYAWFAIATQQNNYKQTALDTKIFTKLSESDQKIAQQKYQELFDQFSNQAIDKKLNPVFTGKNMTAKDYRPIKKVVPEYPMLMLRQGKSGIVDIIFSIDKNGFTKDHLAYYSSSKTFERTAIEALRKFQYEPMIINGKPVDVNGIKRRFNFQITGTEYDDKRITKLVDEMREKANAGDDSDKLGFAFFLEAIPSFTKKYPLKDNPNEWYLAAANSGSSVASYFLGRNILYGNMCTQDTTQSMGWLLKSAKAGISDAQYMLATESFNGSYFEKDEEKGFYWLSKAAGGKNKSAKIKYAWILATHKNNTKRNGKLAAEMLKEIDDNYYDKQSFYEAMAAVLAENGDFKAAIKWQQKAIEDATTLELPLRISEARLKSYLNKTPWREEI